MKKASLKQVLTLISGFGPAVLVSVESFDPARRDDKVSRGALDLLIEPLDDAPRGLPERFNSH
jgi:hypothetical protein